MPTTCPPTEPLQLWLNRLLAGETLSPEELCHLCERDIRRLVRPRLRTFPLVAQDSQTTEVVNKTIMDLLGAFNNNVRPPTVLDLERLVACVIRRVLLDMNKAIQRRRKWFGPLGDRTVPQADDSPFDTGLMVAFHEYVQALPPDEQTLFDVFYYRGKTKEEAARVLGLPPTTVHTRWTKARYKLSLRFGRDVTE